MENLSLEYSISIEFSGSSSFLWKYSPKGKLKEYSRDKNGTVISDYLGKVAIR